MITIGQSPSGNMAACHLRSSAEARLPGRPTMVHRTAWSWRALGRGWRLHGGLRRLATRVEGELHRHAVALSELRLDVLTEADELSDFGQLHSNKASNDGRLNRHGRRIERSRTSAGAAADNQSQAGSVGGCSSVPAGNFSGGLGGWFPRGRSYFRRRPPPPVACPPPHRPAVSTWN